MAHIPEKELSIFEDAYGEFLFYASLTQKSALIFMWEKTKKWIWESDIVGMRQVNEISSVSVR